MPRDGSNIYHLPVGTPAVTDTSIESTKYNNFTSDIEQDLNTPRPIVAGGTGATSAVGALTALGGEKAGQVIVNYSSDTFIPGSFYSASTATGAPVSGHAFCGICYAADASNMFIQARDQDDSVQPGKNYVRQMKAGVWSAWKAVDADPALYVDTAGDTMTGLLILSGDPAVALGAATKQYADTKLALSGGTMTGAIVLAADPAAPLQPATQQYVVPKAGGTMTGLLILSADPAVGLGAATKQYVDNAIAGGTSNVMLKTGNQTITGGFMVTPANLGTTGSFTVNPALGNYQYCTSNSGAAVTITAPATDCAVDILLTNGASAGAITWSGFTVGALTGDAYVTTNGAKFIFSIRRINAISTYVIKALQ